MKAFLSNKPVQILSCTAIGILLVAISYSPGGSRTDRFGSGSWGPTFQPVILALGITILVAAIMLYRKWSSEHKQKDSLDSSPH